MSIGTVFLNNRTQAVRLPLDVRLPEGVHKVEIRVKGQERIIAPLGQSWDSFFLDGPRLSHDFLLERASQQEPDREAL
jgi:antitoxin VapB